MLNKVGSEAEFAAYAQQFEVYLNTKGANASVLLFNEHANLQFLEEARAVPPMDTAEAMMAGKEMLASSKNLIETVSAAIGVALMAEADASGSDDEEEEEEIDAEALKEYTAEKVEGMELSGAGKTAFEKAAAVLFKQQLAQDKTLEQVRGHVKFIQEPWVNIRAKIKEHEEFCKAKIQEIEGGLVAEQISYRPARPTLEDLMKDTVQYSAAYATVKAALQVSFGGIASELMSDNNISEGVDRVDGCLHKMFARAHTRKKDERKGVRERSHFLDFFAFEFKGARRSKKKSPTTSRRWSP